MGAEEDSNGSCVADSARVWLKQGQEGLIMHLEGSSQGSSIVSVGLFGSQGLFSHLCITNLQNRLITFAQPVVFHLSGTEK